MPGTPVSTATALALRRPRLQDGRRLWQLVRASPPLELNASCLYLLLCYHFPDTCVVAEKGGNLVGFAAAYQPPVGGNSVFVWQVAVQASHRGGGVAGRMLMELLQRDACRGARYVEAAVKPSDRASQAMMRGLARRLNTSCEERLLFAPTLFGDENHEEERLFRVGPFTAPASSPPAAGPEPPARRGP